MRIKLTSFMVDDQEKALRFFTDVLGFKKKHDIPVGEYRWITVTSPEGPDDLELVLDHAQWGRPHIEQEVSTPAGDLDEIAHDVGACLGRMQVGVVGPGAAEYVAERQEEAGLQVGQAPEHRRSPPGDCLERHTGLGEDQGRVHRNLRLSVVVLAG